MSEIGEEEVESLGRALACQYGRGWASMAPDGQDDTDLNSSRKSWLRRARVILEAVHEAMIVHMKREYVVEKNRPRSPGRGGDSRKVRQTNKRPQVPNQLTSGEAEMEEPGNQAFGSLRNT